MDRWAAPTAAEEEQVLMALLPQVLEDFDLKTLRQWEASSVAKSECPASPSSPAAFKSEDQVGRQIDQPEKRAKDLQDDGKSETKNHQEVQQDNVHSCRSLQAQPRRGGGGGASPAQKSANGQVLEQQLVLLHQVDEVQRDVNMPEHARRWQMEANQSTQTLDTSFAMDGALKRLQQQNDQIAQWLQWQLLMKAPVSAATSASSLERESTVTPVSASTSGAWISDELPRKRQSNLSELHTATSPKSHTAGAPRLKSSALVPLTKRKSRRNPSHVHYQARLRWLTNRIQASVTRIDLVFQRQHLKPTPTFPSYLLGDEPASFSTLPWCCEVHILNQGQEGLCAELAGYTISCFDAQTLSKLLWNCFGLLTFNQSVDQVDMTGNVIESFKSASKMADETRHGTCNFEFAVGKTTVRVKGLGAVRQYPQVLVWEAVGQVDVVPMLKDRRKKRTKDDMMASGDGPAMQMEFTRTVWIRVEQLPDGRSVLHHVHHMRPVTVRSKVLQDDPMQQKQLETFGEVLQRLHSDMSAYFQGLIVEQLADANALQRAESKGWPLNYSW